MTCTVRKAIVLAAVIGWLVTTNATAVALGPATRPTTRPTTTTIDVDAANADEAAQRLGRQFGFPVIVRLPGPLQYAGEPRPFVVAVGTFLTNSGLTCDDTRTSFELIPGPVPRVVPVTDTVALAITRIRLSAGQSFGDPTTRPAGYGYALFGRVLVDPALKVIGVSASTPPDAVEVDGVALPASSRHVGDEASSLTDSLARGPGELQCEVHFNTDTPARRATRVRGRLRLWQAVETAAVDVGRDDVLAGKRAQGNGVAAAVTIDEAHGPTSLLVRLTGPVVERYRSGGWSVAERHFVRVLDPNGETLPTLNDAGEYQTATNTLTVRLRPVGPPEALIGGLGSVAVRLPTKVKSFDLPYEIKDLELPGN